MEKFLNFLSGISTYGLILLVILIALFIAVPIISAKRTKKRAEQKKLYEKFGYKSAKEAKPQTYWTPERLLECNRKRIADPRLGYPKKWKILEET